jgi:hypothetical protein
MDSTHKTYVQQVTKIYKETNKNEVAFETVDTVPLLQFESGKFIRINGDDYRVVITKAITPLSNKELVTAIVISRVYSTLPNADRVQVGIYLRHLKEVPDSIYYINMNASYSQSIHDDVKHLNDLINLFKPMLATQAYSYKEFMDLMNEENILKANINAERNKIIQKEKREQARLIAAAQLEKERRTVQTVSKRKDK